MIVVDASRQAKLLVKSAEYPRNSLVDSAVDSPDPAAWPVGGIPL